MNMQRALLYVVAAVAAASTGLALRQHELAQRRADTQALVSPETLGAPAAALQLPDLDGQMHALSDYRGRVVLVNFWATWCPPCLREIPTLQQVRTRYRDHGFEILGVAVDGAEAVRAFVAEHGIGYPQLIAGPTGSGVMAAFGNRHGVLPYSLLVDRAGTVRMAHAGALESEDLVPKIETLLGTPPRAATD